MKVDQNIDVHDKFIYFEHLKPPPKCIEVEPQMTEDMTSWIISQMPEINFIYKELRYISDRIRKRDLDESFEKEWKYASMVLDR